MNLLLDTHVLLWWVHGERIQREAAAAIADIDNVKFVSAASIWEISIKTARGKLSVDEAFDSVVEDDFEPLPITYADARLAGSLPDHHRDPFDRMLVAQALNYDLLLVTRDPQIGLYGANILPA
ncbi:type II toxin-antitoxin system VapC family toxin [Candidatus Poriferisocius sp.]|uniref:type II toxin-antitoxin system VapC family toxin n=1 Tax=Candidatus Poriferisocius sp. TaxID=3101276 RepID=UPI003B0108E2